jgi:streptogramin lyase
MLTYRRPSALRLLAMVFALVTGLAIVLGAMLSAAQAAPVGTLKQFRVPTDNSQPRHITVGSDGNLWFTEGNEIFTPNPDPETGGTFHRNIGRITPAGNITEFRIESGIEPDQCFCSLNDIVQGPGGILYFTTNNPGLGRITTSGEVLPFVAPDNSLANGDGIAARGNNVWYADFNNDSIWRYNVTSGQFKEFPLTPGATPVDVAVASDGFVWFTERGAGAIGRLNPQSGAFTETPVPGGDAALLSQIAIAPDGSVWFTERLGHAVGRLVPATNQVTEFPTLTPDAGPEGIAAAPNGDLWFTQVNADNIARITLSGTITEGKAVKNSEPFGITVGPGGNPWYTMPPANKIATLQLR